MQKHILYIFLFLTTLFYKSSSAFNYEELIYQLPETLLAEADRYYEANILDTALIYYTTLTRKYDPQALNQHTDLIVKAYLKVGEINLKQYNYNEALFLYQEGVRIAEKENIETLLPQFYIGIGNAYNMFLDYDEGKFFYNKALELAKQQEDLVMQWKLYSNLIGTCCNGATSEEDIEEARYYYDQLVELPLENDTLKRYYELFNLGYIYNTANLSDSAIFYLDKSLEYIMEMSPQSIYGYYPASLLATLFSQKKQYNRSLEYYSYCSKITQENDRIDLSIHTFSNIAPIYSSLGYHEKAYQYALQYFDLQDSIFNLRKIDLKEFNKLRSYQMSYEMDKVNWKIDMLNAEKEKSEIIVRTQRNMILIISFSLLLLLVFFVIVYVQKSKLKKAYINLFERNNEIIKSDKENQKLRNEYKKKLEEKDKQLQQVMKEANLEANTITLEIRKEETDTGKSMLLTEEQKQELIYRINQIMENTYEFCDCDFNLLRLAELVSSNTKYVSYIINEVYNKNFRNYINEYRIKEASIRLLDTEKYGNYTIKAIAESVGFKSHTTFITIFKKITGINPSIYQKIARNEL